MTQSGSGPVVGIDLGGTKITGIVLNAAGGEIARRRTEAPRGSYAATIEALREVVTALEARVGARGRAVGLGVPGSVSKRTGLVQNANSTWLNGHDVSGDLALAIARPVRLANDANCFALSEARDGAGRDAATVFGVILGTGTGGGIIRRGEIVDGPLGIGGEWGHNPLPWPEPDEYPGPQCWCGRKGCMEVWVSGPGLAADHARRNGGSATAEAITAAAEAGDAAANATLHRHTGRLARGLAHVVNIIDPDVIVLGGGLSKLDRLYRDLPGLMAPHIFADAPTIAVRPPVWGDDGGVRGAAWLAAAVSNETLRD